MLQKVSYASVDHLQLLMFASWLSANFSATYTNNLLMKINTFYNKSNHMYENFNLQSLLFLCH